MSNKATKVVVLVFTKVLRITDSWVQVRTRQGEAVKIEAPFDKSLKMRVDGSGEGTCQCPKYLLS